MRPKIIIVADLRHNIHYIYWGVRQLWKFGCKVFLRFFESVERCVRIEEAFWFWVHLLNSEFAAPCLCTLFLLQAVTALNHQSVDLSSHGNRIMFESKTYLMTWDVNKYFLCTFLSCWLQEEPLIVMHFMTWKQCKNIDKKQQVERDLDIYNVYLTKNTTLIELFEVLKDTSKSKDCL